MKLSEYLAAHDLTDPAFAAMLGCDRTTVLRWRSEKVMPEREQMRRIAEVTDGEVTANDFYGIAQSVATPTTVHDPEWAPDAGARTPTGEAA